MIDVTPLKSGGRSDWTVSPCRESVGVPASFADTDIVDKLRYFFDRLESEAEQHRDDPVALVNALARIEALAADVRYARDSIKSKAAEALKHWNVRRMTVEQLITVEGTSDAPRSNWEHQRLMTDMFRAAFGTQLVNTETGDMFDTEHMAEIVLEWFRCEWRLTPVRNAGLNPDDYCEQATDEDGKPMRTPTIRIHDNVLRKQQVVKP